MEASARQSPGNRSLCTRNNLSKPAPYPFRPKLSGTFPGDSDAAPSITHSTTTTTTTERSLLFARKRLPLSFNSLPYFLLNRFTMSSSITIPTRTSGESSKAAAARSSSSSYSISPQTPKNQNTSTATSTPTTYGHDRRPSLLSEFILFLSLFTSKADLPVLPAQSYLDGIVGKST